MRARPRTSPRGAPQQFPNLYEEQSLATRGFCRIAGIDEAGRGSWAGPLVASAVCLPPPDGGLLSLLEGVRDSKQLTPARRAELFPRILECALDVGIGVVSPATIDRIGLAKAGELAMLWAVEDLAQEPDALLIDAFSLRGCTLHQRSIIHGDCVSLSIASASIVAKVSRDQLMCSAETLYPGYGFRIHKGYGTELHRRALERYGPCSYHRRSFEPVRAEREMPT